MAFNQSGERLGMSHHFHRLNKLVNFKKEMLL